MTKYIARAVVGVAPTLIILTFLVSLMVRLIPGTAVDVMLTDSGASQADRAKLTHQLGLDRSFPRQYLDYLGSIRDRSFGHSIFNGQPLMSQLAPRLPPSIELAVFALLLSWVLGVTVGVTSAMRRNSVVDYALRIAVNGFIGVPNFVIAALIITLPAYYFGWTPPLTFVRFSSDPVGNLTFFIAPTLVLGLGLAAGIARIARTTTLEALNQDYMRTARAKGLTERVVIMRHLLRNSLLPVITLTGIQLAFLISGVVIIEQVFSVPGVGTFLLQAIRNRDYPLVQGITFLIGAMIISLNLLVDVLHPVLDPRVHL